MSLIGLLTATEKQVHIGLAIQDPFSGIWKKKRQLEGTRIIRKGDPYPQVSASPSKWWLEEDNVLQGQPLC